MAEPRIHRLKTVRPYYDHVVYDRKTFEIRKNDRDFRVGDVLILDEYKPNDGGYTGSYCVRQVSYLVQGVYGLPDDVCVMGLVHAVLHNAPGPLRGLPSESSSVDK